MADDTVVDFNRLPRTTRERIVDSLGSTPRLAPLFADPQSKTKPLFWWSVLGLYCLYSFLKWTLWDFGEVGPMANAVHNLWALPIYFGSAFFLTAAVLAIAFHVMRSKALPFPPGRYLFPLDFIDARSQNLRIVSLSELDDFKAVHEHTNGAYTHTTFTFDFGGGHREPFVVRNKDEAEKRMRKLQRARATFGKALENKDANAVHFFDLFHEVRVRGGFASFQSNTSPVPQEGVLAGELPRLLERRWLAALAVSLVLACGTWLVRNLLSDYVAFSSARTAGLESGFRDYLRTGWLHVDKAKELGEKAGFSECEQKDTEACWRAFTVNWSESPRLQEARVERMPRAALKHAPATISALRRFRVKYPNSVVDAEAKERIHQLFVQALTDFQSQASTQNPGLVPFVGKLLAHLEATENPKVLVRFRRVASPSLEEADKLLVRAGREAGRATAEVSPHFADERFLPIENDIVQVMGNAFKQIFPTDLLVLEKGAALDSLPGTVKAGVPVLGIVYTVGWSGASYSSSKDNRMFVGIAFDFDVDMSLPNEKPLRFSLTVKPPDHFTVEYSRYVGRGGLDLDPSGGPTGETVYRIMALRAFDELGDKLRHTFFRSDSKAFMAGGTASNASP
ncbi:hypothetical protein ACN28I_35955 [Archangium gephyra]|uniref:hypothetical protein n=1 Tax=Archangium gephyra TaxID=48 RepID=UPI003B787D53